MTMDANHLLSLHGPADLPGFENRPVLSNDEFIRRAGTLVRTSVITAFEVPWSSVALDKIAPIQLTDELVFDSETITFESGPLSALPAFAFAEKRGMFAETRRVELAAVGRAVQLDAEVFSGPSGPMVYRSLIKTIMTEIRNHLSQGVMSTLLVCAMTSAPFRRKFLNPGRSIADRTRYLAAQIGCLQTTRPEISVNRIVDMVGFLSQAPLVLLLPQRAAANLLPSAQTITGPTNLHLIDNAGAAGALSKLQSTLVYTTASGMEIHRLPPAPSNTNDPAERVDTTPLDGIFAGAEHYLMNGLVNLPPAAEFRSDYRTIWVYSHAQDKMMPITFLDALKYAHPLRKPGGKVQFITAGNNTLQAGVTGIFVNSADLVYTLQTLARIISGQLNVAKDAVDPNSETLKRMGMPKPIQAATPGQLGLFSNLDKGQYPEFVWNAALQLLLKPAGLTFEELSTWVALHGYVPLHFVIMRPRMLLNSSAAVVTATGAGVAVTHVKPPIFTSGTSPGDAVFGMRMRMHSKTEWIERDQSMLLPALSIGECTGGMGIEFANTPTELLKSNGRLSLLSIMVSGDHMANLPACINVAGDDYTDTTNSGTRWYQYPSIDMVGENIYPSDNIATAPADFPLLFEDKPGTKTWLFRPSLVGPYLVKTPGGMRRERGHSYAFTTYGSYAGAREIRENPGTYYKENSDTFTF